MTVASLDLESPDDLKLLNAQWRFAPGWVPGEPNEGLVAQSLESAPRMADFDDSSWEILTDVEPRRSETGEGGENDPGLRKRRSIGLTFGWYRIRVTLPERLGDLNVTGNQVWFETNIDDYGEVWADGELSKAGAINGMNIPTRILVSNDAQPGNTHVIACLAINGPLAAPFGGIFMRYAKLEFEGNITFPRWGMAGEGNSQTFKS